MHMYKGYKDSTHCPMIHAQYEYKYGKDRYIPRAGHPRISVNTVHEAQAQYKLCNGTTTVRVKTRANRYTARAGHPKPLHKRYTHSTHCAIVHAQLRVQKRVKRTYPCWPCQTTVQEVQARYTLCNGTTTVRVKIRANRYTARAGHAKPLYKGYTHSTHCAIVHAQYAAHGRPLYMRHKHSTHCAMVQPQYELKHGPIGTRPVLATLNHCTRGTRIVHTVQ